MVDFRTCAFPVVVDIVLSEKDPGFELAVHLPLLYQVGYLSPKHPQ
jgi:hypothetical protein